MTEAPASASALSIGPRLRKSPFYEATLATGATAFTVYNHMLMPASYGDPEGEYWRLVRGASLWDVAAQRQVEIRGRDASRLTQYLTPRSLAQCPVGQGLYAPLCDHAGRLINDPILLKLEEDRYWLSLADRDILLWVRAVCSEGGFDAEAFEPDASPLAIQGPLAEDVTAALAGDWVRQLKLFAFKTSDIDGIPCVIQRSGWSRQGGFELYLTDGSAGGRLWNLAMESGKPWDIGPGYPHLTERIEGALLSQTADVDDCANPLEMRLDRFVDLDQEADFIGKKALQDIARRGPTRLLCGLFIEGERLPPNQEAWPVTEGGRPIGAVTGAAFSLRLERNIALALIESGTAERIGAEVKVATPMGARRAQITAIPFC